MAITHDSTSQAGTPVFTVPVPGLPSRCRYCGVTPDPLHWPLGYHANQIVLTCPSCHSSVGTLTAVPPEAVTTP